MQNNLHEVTLLINFDKLGAAWSARLKWLGAGWRRMTWLGRVGRRQPFHKCSHNSTFWVQHTSGKLNLIFTPVHIFSHALYTLQWKILFMTILQPTQILHKPLIEQLNISVLHVIFVLLHRSPRLLLTAKGDFSIAAGSAVLVVLDYDVCAVSHRAKPLKHVPT